MKKIVAMILVSMMLFQLTSCSEGKDKDTALDSLKKIEKIVDGIKIDMSLCNPEGQDGLDPEKPDFEDCNSIKTHMKNSIDFDEKAIKYSEVNGEKISKDAIEVIYDMIEEELKEFEKIEGQAVTIDEFENAFESGD